MAEQDKEVRQWKKRMIDLAQRSYRQNIYTFTEFLGLAQLDAFWQVEPQVRMTGYQIFGGNQETTRNIIRFGKEEELGYELDFPILCIQVKPRNAKFAEVLSHRDVLGALMNLGIDRGTVGDIFCTEEEVYLYCLDTVAEHICQNLDQIKHTKVQCSVVEQMDFIVQEEPDMISVQVASLRVDALIAKAYGKSRSACLAFFRAGKVFVDGRLCENNARMLQPNETVNVRGFGKFVLQEQMRETKKGKLSVNLLLYR